MIHAIDRSSVQKICSGQVVVDLATAVKEMVENSLDSGATAVEVRLKEMGAHCIEVSDNGSGIDPSNYSGIARKHFTSKLQAFEDIYSVSSFGFRGEALNALCELSEKFTVITKQEDQPVGTILEFDRNGQLLSQGVAARTNGTTVTVDNLFEKLPVRRKEFVKSIKKHFQKMVRVIQSYALISVGVKIIVTNTSAAGVKQTVFTTQSGGKLSDNVSILFGAKFAASLLPIELEVSLGARPSRDNSVENTLESSDSLEGDKAIMDEETSPNTVSFSSFAEDADKDESEAKEETSNQPSSQNSNNVDAVGESVVNKVHVKGLVSKVGLGVGRSDNDRQFMFVNGRPVDLPRFAKVLNEVWRRYEMKQKPAFVLDVTVPAGYFDVNLTPDKREVLIVQEALVLEQLRECVDAMYQPVRRTMQLNQGVAQSTLLTSLWSTTQSSISPSTSTNEFVCNGSLCDGLTVPSTGSTMEENVKNSSEVTHTSTAPSQDTSLNDLPGSPPPVWATAMDRERLLRSPLPSSSSRSSSRLSTAGIVETITSRLTSSSEVTEKNLVYHSPANLNHRPSSYDEEGTIGCEGAAGGVDGDSHTTSSIPEAVKIRKSLVWRLDASSALKSFRARLSAESESGSSKQSPFKKEASAATELGDYDPGSSGSNNNSLPTDVADVVSSVDGAFNANDTAKDTVEDTVENTIEDTVSDADDVFDIDNNAPSAHTIVPQEHRQQQDQQEDRSQARVLSKKDFPKMKVAGQFNLGFIIAELNGDLYILDQHACDEKYRFEELQRTTQIHQQPLIRPLPVETSASLELVIAEYQHVFTSNGFRLRVDTSETAGQRVQLLGVPFSKTVHFGVDDVNELASMISERSGNSGNNEGASGGIDSTSERVSKTYLALKNDAVSGGNGAEDVSFRNMPRLPKLVAMYASRACRSAIMIGTAMKVPDMERVVRRLEGVEQPWNCPHGRPTLRHLVDLAPLRHARKRKLRDMDI